jgi:ubiquinone/menaquinone biosynthesis C-methylase UbiE
VERYVIRGGRQGYDRLAVLARAWLPSTSALLDRVGVGPGMRCVDLGCGGGEVSFEIARRVDAAGHVTGIDMDEVKVGLARAAAATDAVGNVEFRVANVHDWSEPDTYDLVYSRFLLEHLRGRVEVLAGMWSSVRPGGVLVVEDADFDVQFCEPADPRFDAWVSAYLRVLTAHGGDPLVGRRLFGLFAQAGIPAPQLHLVQRVEVAGEAKTLPLLTLEATADVLVGEGVTTPAEVVAMRAGLTAIAADVSTILGSPRVCQAWSRRPAC